jgi:hypothetical protein
MQSMDNSIADMYFKGFIDREEAIIRSGNPGKMEKLLAAAGKMETAREPVAAGTDE